MLRPTGRGRRRYIRVGLSLQVSYTIVDTPDKEKELLSKDIGGGGIRLPLGEKLTVGTLLKLKIELLKEKKVILVEGRVVWINDARDDEKYPHEAGIEFINIDFTERTMISNYALYLEKQELVKNLERYPSS